jgi:hypothetical protein
MYKILFVIVLAITTIFFLFAWSDRPNSIKNGFIRKKVEHDYSLKIVKEIHPDWNRIVEINDSSLILSKLQPGHFLKLNLINGTSTNIKFNIDRETNPPTQFRNIYKKGFLFIMAMNTPCIYKCDLLHNTYLKYDLPFKFMEGTMIDEHTAVLRVKQKINDMTKLYLAKLSLGDSIITYNKEILQGKNDAGFSTSGIMNYDTESGTIVYTTFYTHDFICLDTNLKAKLFGHTIDTFENAKMEVKGKSSTGYVFTKPPVSINKKNCTWNNRLYNLSSAKADNDGPGDAKEYLILDIYDIRNGTYQGSHYIKKTTSRNYKDFKLLQSRLVVLYEGYIEIYQL